MRTSLNLPGEKIGMRPRGRECSWPYQRGRRGRRRRRARGAPGGRGDGGEDGAARVGGTREGGGGRAVEGRPVDEAGAVREQLEQRGAADGGRARPREHRGERAGEVEGLALREAHQRE